MKRDPKFTEELQNFLTTPEQERDYEKGNLLLLQLSNNRIRYQNFARNPASKAEFINYQLQKYLNFRLADLTHEQVTAMETEVKNIDAKIGLDKDNSQYKKTNKEFKSGKRADHDSLPEEIQSLYIENLSFLQKMRELHMQLRNLSLDNAPCPDSERYPFLKELIALDKKMHDNWHTYDTYTVGSVSDASASESKTKAKSKKATVSVASAAEKDSKE